MEGEGGRGQPKNSRLKVAMCQEPAAADKTWVRKSEEGG